MHSDAEESTREVCGKLDGLRSPGSRPSTGPRVREQCCCFWGRRTGSRERLTLFKEGTCVASPMGVCDPGLRRKLLSSLRPQPGVLHQSGQGQTTVSHRGPHGNEIINWTGDAELTPTDAIYFSVSTFTTAGLGDITPRTEATRRSVSLELLCSLALISVGLAIVLSRRPGAGGGPA
jgi:hypothetical protein